ncbi:MAG: hypothetical protein AAGA27_01560 [Pseudomonadota bacterium]
MRVKFILTLVLSLLFFSVATAASNHFANVELIEKNHQTGNLLFRGPIPMIGKSFAGEALLAKMKTLDADFPENYVFVDIDLIGDDQNEVAMEKSSLATTFKQSTFLSWPVFGVRTVPTNPIFSKFYKRQDNISLLAEPPQPGNPSYDIHLAQLLTTMMQTRYNTPHVFYIHCAGGCDRAGQLSTMYMMLKQQTTAQLRNEIFQYLSHNDIQGCRGRMPNNSSLDAILWGCYYIANRDQPSASAWQQYNNYYAHCSCIYNFIRGHDLESKLKNE